MEQSSGVTVRGTRDGLTIQVSEEVTVSQILERLTDKFRDEAAFFQDAELILDLGSHPFQEDEIRSLRELFDSSSIRLKGILSDNPITKIVAHSEGIALLGDRSIMSSRTRVDHPVKTERLHQEDQARRGSRGSAPAQSGALQREPALFVKKTLRAGQDVHFVGDVTILGDVNPGAEVVASGNIAVFGSLRGVAHAGAEGKKEAVVAALELCPTQLRIADCIGRAPESSPGAVREPELARIVDGQIMIERYIK